METHGQACVDLAHVGRPDANLGPADLVPMALLPLPGRVNPAGLGLEDHSSSRLCVPGLSTLSTPFLPPLTSGPVAPAPPQPCLASGPHTVVPACPLQQPGLRLWDLFPSLSFILIRPLSVLS